MGKHGGSSFASRGSTLMTEKIKFTTSEVAKQTLKEDETDKIIWALEEKGFGYRLRRTAKGISKHWILQYRFGRQQRRISLDASDFTLERARKIASDYRALQLGTDPAAERDKARDAASAITLTLGDVAGRYLDAKRDVLSLSTY